MWSLMMAGSLSSARAEAASPRRMAAKPRGLFMRKGVEP
jgi:hypothetical protein